MSAPERQDPIAIVGVAALFPGSIDRAGFWRDILAGRDLTTDVPATHWLIEDYYDPDPRARDKTYAKRGAFLPEVDFDPVAWGVPPSNLPATDTSQLLALIVAQQVLEDACGGQFKDLPRERVSVILGVTSAQELLGSMVSRLQRPIWSKALREQGLSDNAVTEACDRIASHYGEWQESTFPGVLGNVVAGRIANRLDLGGTNCVADAACASSFAALSMAVGELRLGHSDLVITGGVDTMNDIFMYVCFSKTPALSPTGDCRPFAEEGDGTLLGEGIGMVALKRLADAERDNDRIYAVVKGVGASSDGRAKSVYAPVAAGQAVALRRAYQQASYGPETVELVEAHGTGTRAGDAAEFAALREVFDATGRPDRGWCALGSVKSQVGHTKAASGAAGLFKATMALAHKVLPPTIKVNRPDPKLDIQTSPFYLNTVARPWFRDGCHPRRASVSSFGFGGSNFHLALEEYTGPGRRALRVRPAGPEVVLLGAPSAAALADRCRELARDAGQAGMLVHLARSTQESFEVGAAARLAIVAESERDLESKLTKAAELARGGRDFSIPGSIGLSTGEPTRDVAFLFPGQGSQYLNMGADTCMAIEVARQAWDGMLSLDLAPGGPRLDEVVFPRPVFDEKEVEGQRARLTATEWAQPAIGAASLSLLEILRALGVRPAAVAGHSFGEITALHAAGVMPAADFLRVARRRGELMAEAATAPGAMVSVAGRGAEIESHLGTWELDVVIANYNSPNQTILSGAVEAIADAERRFAELGMATTRLDVATAFHSRIVEPACAPFRAFLEGIPFSPPVVDVYSNASAGPYPAAAAAMRDVLGRQIAQPVRFVDQIEAMYARGIHAFVEVGPGNVLTSLVGHILKNRPHSAIALNRKGRTGLACLNEGLGQLSLAGVPLAYARLWADFAPVADPRLAPRPAMTVKIGGSNYAKPYPPHPGAIPVSKPSVTGSPAPTPTAAPPRPEPAAPSAVPVARATSVSIIETSHNGRTRGPLPVAPALITVLGSTHAESNSAVQLAWVGAFQETQRQTAESHSAFQRAMAEAHAAFLRSTETSMNGLVALLGGGSAIQVAAPAPPVQPIALPESAAEIDQAQSPWASPHASSSVAFVPSIPARMMPPPEVLDPADGRQESRPIAAYAGAAAVAAPEAAPILVGASGVVPPVDLRALMLRVVAKCTGYPEEMLGLDMDLEADLGVDSIKRVEILAAALEQAPSLPKVSGAKIASKRTLREIIAYFESESTEGNISHVNGDGPAQSGTGVVVALDDRADGAGDRLVRSVVRAVEGPALGLGVPELLGRGRVVVTDEGTGIAAALVARFTASGVSATVENDVPSDADTVILLDGLCPLRNFEHAMAVNRAAFRAARAVAARFSGAGGTFITVQDTGGSFGLDGTERAWLGGIAGLAKTAALEWPEAHVRALDLERGDRPAAVLADAIWNELLAGGVEREVGLRADGRRVVLAVELAALETANPSTLPLSPTSVVLASGGARGVTADCLIAIAKAARCRFLLLGRTPLSEEPEPSRGLEADADIKRALLLEAQRNGLAPTPVELGRAAASIRSGREVRRTLDRIRAAGGEARYQSVDVVDAAAVATAVASARADWGPISGIVHGAGLLADKLIAEKTDAQFDLVFNTKVLGLRALLGATQDDDLSFLVLFSSIAARLGNPGQADYAMANEVLNKVAASEQRRRGSRCLVRALDWGPWAGGMVDEGLRAHFSAVGMPLIPIAAGTQQLHDELAANANDKTNAETEVVICGPGYSAPLNGPRAEVASFDLLVGRTSYPFLDGHRVKGEPVVPVALVLEWFARAARFFWPDLSTVTFRRLQVLRGIRLAGFDDGNHDRFMLRARKAVDGARSTLSLELLGNDGSRHYSATAERGGPAERPSDPPAGARGVPWSGAIYGRNGLFHGPSFQVIREIEGVSGSGLVASIVGAQDRGWQANWSLDPALLDGSLQVALLWTRHLLGGPSLPTAIESVSLDVAGPVPGRVRCILASRDATADRAVMDLTLVAENGATIAELRGVVTHLLPGKRDTAGKSKVVAEEPGGSR